MSGVPAQCVITQTVINVTSASAQLIAANPRRKFLMWMLVGANDVTIAEGTSPAVFGAGMIYSTGGSANKQGASQVFDVVVPIDAFQVICSSGLTSTVIVWEGQ